MWQQLIGPINPLTWAGLFIAYFFLDVLYTKNMLFTVRLQPTAAANTGVVIYLISIWGTLEYVNNLTNVVPIALASWLGTYLTLRWEIKINKRDEVSKSMRKSRKPSARRISSGNDR